MRIRFTRGRGKPDTLTCFRDDGTATWTSLYPGFGAAHDLAHFAVETTLGYRNAFFGLLASGRTIQSFEEKDERNRSAHPLEPEAGWSEYLAGALQSEDAGGYRLDAATMLEQMKTHVASRRKVGSAFAASSPEGVGFTFPEELTDAQLDSARTLWHELLARWDAVPPDGHLELEF
ncbi:MAG TPA: hypothetical protein VM490_05400 [Armatimonadaceae bacterium]|nr:hypothetical protein [Armatimonadaceae bacterium]